LWAIFFERDFSLLRNSAVLSRVQEISEDVAGDHDAFVVDVCLRGQRDSQVLEVFVDTDRGITADECARISRDLSYRLDQESLIAGRYNLVVSSPGLDRPLKFRRQYGRNIGRKLEVRYHVGSDVKTLTGTLIRVEEDAITLAASGSMEDITIPFQSIQESKVEIEFRTRRTEGH